MRAVVSELQLWTEAWEGPATPRTGLGDGCEPGSLSSLSVGRPAGHTCWNRCPSVTVGRMPRVRNAPSQPWSVYWGQEKADPGMTPGGQCECHLGGGGDLESQSHSGSMCKINKRTSEAVPIDVIGWRHFQG